MLTIDDFERLIRSAQGRPLPGVRGQLPMAPRPRIGWSPDGWPDDCRKCGALMLFYPREAEAHLVLTLRAADIRHPGQVSLPGGVADEGETVEQAALREAQEELAVESSSIRLLGPLSPLHVPVSQSVIFPQLGVSAVRPQFRAQAGEVERVLEVPARELFDPASVGRYSVDEGRTEVPFFDLQGSRVWGATAMILAELLTWLGQAPDPWKRPAP